MGVDIVFSFDTTGSQFPIIAELRRKVEQTMRRLFNTIPDLRIGLIAHGDYNDRYAPQDYKAVPLTTNIEQLAHFIKNVDTTNGFGNGGEAYELAMHVANGFDWSGDNRVFVLIGDEPAHELRPTYQYYPKAKYDWRAELTAMQSNSIIPYVVRCQDRSDSKAFHNEYAKRAQTPLLHLAQFNDIERLVLALTYRAQSKERAEEYGRELETSGTLNRNMAHILNLLLDADNLIGGIDFAQSSGDLEAVDPFRFQILHVDRKIDIKSFVESTGAAFRKGRGFYQLTKAEDVQERKEVVLRNDKGDMFTGDKAREMIGVPSGTRGRVYVNQLPHGYEVYVQSTSVNRVLMPDTKFLYENA